MLGSERAEKKPQQYILNREGRDRKNDRRTEDEVIAVRKALNKYTPKLSLPTHPCTVGEHPLGTGAEMKIFQMYHTA